MAVSNVAPPHISSENSPACAGPHSRGDRGAGRSVRIRVASSDWWASRMVVSVKSSRFWSRSHFGEFSLRPEVVRIRSRVPLGKRAGRRHVKDATD